MQSQNSESFDVIVIGGGPAGSTISTLVAMQKHAVLLLEKEQHPRYQIGESLLPSTIHGICNMLGVSDEIKRAGFTRKLGGTFRWGRKPEPWNFNFSRSPTMTDPTSYAFQVERSKFDHILLLNARRKGVQVREKADVQEVLFESGRAVGVRYVDDGGATRVVRARYVVDASGNTTNHHQKVGKRIFSKFFQNIALFCYFENGKRLPPPNNGNILSAAFADGWIWYIPLSPTLTSVGAVIAKEKAAMLQQDHEKAMNGFIAACPIIKDYLSNARRVTEGQYGRFRVRKDYSYTNERFTAPGMLLVGDTACFVDPVISSGVHLATYSALLAARSLNTVLRGGVDEASCFREYELRYRREYGNFYKFLAGFYDMHKDENSYFWEARKVIQSEEEAQQAFVRLVSGTNTGESVYASADELLEASKDRQPFLAEGQTMAKGPELNGIDAVFTEGFGFDGGEIVQMMTQAMWGPSRPKEQPFFQGGLVPTADGFHWRDPTSSS